MVVSVLWLVKVMVSLGKTTGKYWLGGRRVEGKGIGERETVHLINLYPTN